MLNDLIQRYPALESCAQALRDAVQTLIGCYSAGGKVLVCGNGGSCADADHITGELLKGFLKKRPLSEEQKAQMMASGCVDAEMLTKLQNGLPAIPLPALTAVNSAFCNDVDPELMYAQALLALGKPGDVLIAISTSGNAKNVFAAAKVAKATGITVVALTGKTGGRLKEAADICVCVPETETYKIQELHLPAYHYICAAVEAHFFAE